MKRYITKVLQIVAGFLFCFPVLYLPLAAILFDIPLSQCLGLFLSPVYFVTIFCAMMAGYGLWEMRRGAWYWFVVSQVLVIYENASFAIHVSESHHRTAAFFISLILQMALFLRVAREIRVPYLFPRIRWWESNPRYRLSVSVQLVRQSGSKKGETLEGEILDLTQAGCFIKLRAEFERDEFLTLKFNIFSNEIQCQGNAVWLAESTVTHPRGIGVKFGFLSRTQRRLLRLVQKRLNRISKFYRRSRYWMSQEEFLKQLEAIESNTHVPKFTGYKSRSTS